MKCPKCGTKLEKEDNYLVCFSCGWEIINLEEKQ